MEQKETAYFNNPLLDNIELPIDITLVSTPKEVSTPSLLNNSPSKSLRNTKTSSSDESHIAKIENYIDQKFDQVALKHLKFQILTKIKNDLDKDNTNIKKMESKVLGTTITTFLESLDHTSKPSRVKCIAQEKKLKKICLAAIVNNY